VRAVRVYLTIFLATVSTVFVPVPEEAALLGAGYVARLGHASLAGCIGATWLAVMVGDAFSYLVGRELLGRLLRTRLGQRMLPEPRRAWAERMVAGHGARAIVLARFFVGLRGFIYFAVGASRYPLARFLAVDAAAGVVEVGGLVTVGFAFGELHARVGARIDFVAAALLLLALLAPVVVKAVMKTRA
jgi:membrane protein DedA with SNARE-associated domain